MAWWADKNGMPNIISHLSSVTTCRVHQILWLLNYIIVLTFLLIFNLAPLIAVDNVIGFRSNVGIEFWKQNCAEIRLILIMAVSIRALVVLLLISISTIIASHLDVFESCVGTGKFWEDTGGFVIGTGRFIIGFEIGEGWWVVLKCLHSICGLWLSSVHGSPPMYWGIDLSYPFCFWGY